MLSESLTTSETQIPLLHTNTNTTESTSTETEPEMVTVTRSVANKLKGFDFWKQALNGAKYIVAPMVDQSEFAWRKLTRKYGAQLCYTPMFHAKMFGDPAHEGYRKECWITSPEDRPLIVQFCANDPEHLLKAAKLIENECDAVDINLGCPQHIAKRGHYGSFLQDEWELITKMVSTLNENLAIPVTCKIRIFPEVSKTIAYAQMLEKAGCQLLTVHGRVRDQKGHNTGLADWEQIRLVKQSVNIPVFANGNILYFEDVQKCLDYTGVEGIMSAEGVLYNPTLFSGKMLPLWEVTEEYLKICKEHKDPKEVSYIRAHLFKLYKPCLSIFTDLREQLGKAHTMEQFTEVVNKINASLRLEADKVGNQYEVTTDESGIRKYPMWVCQPYIRPPNVLNVKKGIVLSETSAVPIVENDNKRKNSAPVKPSAKSQRTSKHLICQHCSNVASGKCPNLACKQCCHKNFAHAEETSASPCDIHNTGKKPGNVTPVAV